MAETSIEWTDYTFNPWIGCQKVGPGCDNCYAESWDARWSGGEATRWGPGAPRTRTSDAKWKEPLKWARKAAAFVAEHGRRPRVFCASLADVFDNAVDPQWRAGLFDLIRATPELDWQILTKRVGNVADMLPEDWGDGWSHVWLGATVVNQDEADRDIPKLLSTPAAVRFLSVEPMLGAIDLRGVDLLPTLNRGRPAHEYDPEITFDALTGQSNVNPVCGLEDPYPDGVDWVICGGESGKGARPMHPDWARSLRDQCAAAGVPFFFKQWGHFQVPYDRGVDDPDWRECDRIADLTPNGKWLNLEGGHGFHGERVVRIDPVGKAAAGRTLDGATHDAFPDTPAHRSAE